MGKTVTIDGVEHVEKAEAFRESEHVEWRDIPGFPGYQASNMGGVRSRRKELKGQVNRYGYSQVHITDSTGKRRCPYVHRLVMAAFVGESDLTVNHIDEDKANNKLENLEYMTRDENYKYSNASRCKRVAKLDPLTGRVVDVYQSVRQAAAAEDVSRPRIQLCCKGEAVSAGGFGWLALSDGGIDYVDNEAMKEVLV